VKVLHGVLLPGGYEAYKSTFSHDREIVNVDIESGKLYGKPIEERFWITHRGFASGGELEIELGPQPNRSCASDPQKGNIQ
jgi:putative alpha-1,2-mannosidase